MKSIDWPSASCTIAFLTSARRPGRPRNRLVLPFVISVFTPSTVTPNSVSTATLISGFVAPIATRKDELAALAQRRRLLGDDRAANNVVDRLAGDLFRALPRGETGGAHAAFSAAVALLPEELEESRAVRPSKPAEVTTSRSWRRMS